MQNLNWFEREIMKLYINGMSAEAIAVNTQIDIKTVRGTISTSINKLQEMDLD